MLPFCTHRDRTFVSRLRQVAAIAPVVECLENRQLFTTLMGWEIGGVGGWGPSPFAPTTVDAAAVTSTVGLTRGSGVTTSGTAASNAWGANGWHGTSDLSSAVAASKFFTFGFTVASGQQVDLNQIDPFNIRRSSTGPQSYQFQYSINGGAFVDIGTSRTIGGTTTSSGNAQAAIDLSGIAALQDLSAGTTVTFRGVLWGASGSSGTGYLNGVLAGLDFAVNGDVESAPNAPSGVDATAASSTSITVDWTDNSTDETGFEIDRSTTSDFSSDVTTLSVAASGGTGARSYLDTGLAPATQYWYRVRAVKGAILSPNVGPATATTTGDDIAVVSVTGPVVSTAEEGDTLILTVSRTNFGSADAISGTFAINGLSGGADGDDVDTVSGAWSLAAGEESTTFQVQILDDTTPEGTEQFEAVISIDGSPEGHFLGADTADFSVNASDLPTAVVSITPTSGQSLNEGQSLSYTINRTNATFQDEIVINYTITPTSSGAGGSDLASSSGSVTLAAGAASTSFSVTAIHDDENEIAENFGVSIALAGSPANHSLGDAAGAFAIAANVSMQAQDVATVQPAGPRPGVSGKQFFNIEGTGNGASFWSYGVADFFGYNLPASTVGSIQSISIATIDAPAGFSVNGPVNVYVVSDNLTSIDNNGGSPLIFDGADPEGVNGQLGSQYLLGTVDYNKDTQPESTFTHFELTTLDADGLAVLVNALNTGDTVRLVITPGNASVAATWAGLNIGTVDGVADVVMSPKLTFHYAEPSLLPTWLSADPADATWDGTTLNVTGSATITADPNADLPMINVGAGASLTIDTGTDLKVRIGGLTTAAGASVTMASMGADRTSTDPSANHRVLIIQNGVFNIDPASTVDLADNDLILRGGVSLAEVQTLINSACTEGFTWDGFGLTSSAAADTGSSFFGVVGLGVMLNDAEGFGNPWYAEWNGVTDLLANDVLVKFSWYGDTDLSGLVDDLDFALTEAGYTGGGAGYFYGDLNLDGLVDDLDFALLEAGYTGGGQIISL